MAGDVPMSSRPDCSRLRRDGVRLSAQDLSARPYDPGFGGVVSRNRHSPPARSRMVHGDRCRTM